MNMYKDYDLPSNLIDDIKKEVSKRKISDAKLKNILEKVKEEYRDAKIDAGGAIGVVTAESFGEPSTQMCIAHNEKVILKIRNRIKIMKIGEFIDKVFQRVNTRIENNYEVYNVPDELLVLSLDQDEKLKWSKVLALNRVKAPKRLIKLITQSGRKIVGTDYHSFVIRKNNRVVSIAGKNLKLGDRIPVIQYLPENCSSCVAINDYVSNLKEKDGMVFTNKKSKSIPNNICLDSLFGWFIGAYLAEGNSTDGQISISNVDKDYIFNLKKFVKSIGLDYKEFWASRGFSLGCDIRISSSLLSRFIKNVCKTGSSNKIVPDFAYSAKEEFVSGLLRGYFDGDGNFTFDRRMIRVSSNSEELLDGIKLLLTRFKIFSSKSKDHKQHYLIIPYKYAPSFLRKIGSDIKSKKNILIKLAKLLDINILKNYRDHNDMISGFDNIFVDISRKLSLPSRYVNSATKRQRIGRTALFRYIKRFKSVAREKNIDIKNELKIMKRMFYSDVVWDAIGKIEYVDYNYDYVYDLSVPGSETFTTFDGVIAHNTLNVKHFAGVAEMNVTLGLPRLIEIFDARKSPSTPSMEIYLKDKYSKDPVKVRKIASQLKENVLGDIAEEFSIDLIKMNVKVALDKEKMRNLGISKEVLVKILNKSLRGITVRQNKNEIVLSGKERDLNWVYSLKEKAKNTYIKGVKRISYVLPFKKGNEFIILTAGTNLKEVLKLNNIDSTRTISNNIFEIYSVLGIEAARQAIINESVRVIENQGLNVDIRHIMFIADAMTTSGVIKGITRSGITGEKESVLARASFETPIKHLINASLSGEIDKLNSVIENVMLNQPVPLGTGLPDLVAKMKDEKEIKKKK